MATNSLGAFHSEQGEYELAAELFEESLAIGEVLGDRERRGRELNNLGSMRSRLGDTDGARELMRRGLVAATEIGVVQIQRQSLLGLALCEAEAGNAVVAARLVGQSDALRSRLGSAEEDPSERERTLAAIRGVLGADGLAAELAAGAAMPLEGAIQLALGQSTTELE